jgi:hypothetical protein
MSMNGPTILLRAMDAGREGWQWMSLEEFLRCISLDDWNVKQLLVGVVLPPSGRGRPNLAAATRGVHGAAN